MDNTHIHIICSRVEAVFPRVVELNPYVHVEKSSSTLDDNTDLSFLRKYQVRVRLTIFHNLFLDHYLNQNILLYILSICFRVPIEACKRIV